MTILTMPDGRRSSLDEVHCASCKNIITLVNTPSELASYPGGKCPQCGSSWTGDEKRSTIIQVTMPESITGGAG